MVLRIAVDMDDTLAGTLRHVFRMYRRPIPNTWRFYDSGGISYEKLMRDIKSTWTRHWGEIAPMEPGQFGAMNDLNGLGTVDIVTVGLAGPKTEWLKLHGIRHNEVVEVRDGRDKAKLDYDVFIDDSPVNFQAFKEAGKCCVLFDAEYNQDIDTEFRVRSLAEAVCVIRSLIPVAGKA